MALSEIPLTPDGLKDASKCFQNCLTTDERKKLLIIVGAYELAAVGGTDYTNDIGTLITAAKCFQCLNEDEREAILLYIRVRRAIDAGATFDSTVEGLKALAKCLCIGGEFDENLLLFLEDKYAAAQTVVPT
jgi:hypothetical protein